MGFSSGGSAAVIAAFVGAAATAPPSFAASGDAYTPLEVYGGAWNVVSGKGKALTVRNTCARTGLFYVCEQALDGVSKALVVFLPQGSNDNGAIYRTQTLGADGAEPGHWFHLTIKGAEWVYAPEGVDPRERTLNHVIDADHIRYEIEKRTKAGWRTTSSGVETRIK